MLRYFQKLFLALAIAGAVHSAQAFSLLGPFITSWQVPAIGYNSFGFDIGGPMNLGEEYRWNIRTVTYGFDSSFKNYFGQQGVDAINKGIAILNNLPPFSKMSTNLDEFPLDTRRVNYRASALGLQDLKSAALGMLMEELGLASPDRYTWALRDRRVINNIPFYLVIKRNFDPVTLAPSSYVNGVLYTYGIVKLPVMPDAWDAIEVQVDPVAFGYTAVASDIDSEVSSTTGSGSSGPGLGFGEFYVGLTRDDVGGLRYLYRPNNYNIENLIPGTTGGGFGGGGSGSPWTPVTGGGTNNPTGTNSFVNAALRPGVDHITFQQAKYDSVQGVFVTVTNTYQDTFLTNSSLVTQTTQRVLTQPDILFSAEDLGLDANGVPIFVRRTIAGPTPWVNNNAINGQAALDGPGVINGQIVITFNKLGPFLFNFGPDPNGISFLDELSGFPGFVWGSFDGTTNDPVVYPIGSSIQALEQQVLGGH
jgi:hypothetical protein